VDPKYLSDAAHFPGGYAEGIVVPQAVSEIPEKVRGARSLLVIGGQTSLTGGATPMGEVVLSTEKLTRVLEVGEGFIHVEAGVSVAAIDEALKPRNAWFPPMPTWAGAFAGGIVATNAAGPATFKYGSVRRWVEALTVVLADGSELTVRRGVAKASSYVPIPTYHMPDVVKRSAGYHAEPEMDLIDLFIGSEGTLGVITTVTFRIVSPRPTSALVLVPCRSETAALALVSELRRLPEVAAIEHMDRRSIDILHEDGADRKNHVTLPDETDLVMLVQLELPPGTTGSSAYDEIERAFSSGMEGGALARFCLLLATHDVFDDAEMALPGSTRRAEQLLKLREAVPEGVNQRVGTAQRTIDGRISKTAADMVVPFERFGEMMEIYREGFASRGLDAAVWGHISDGNVHPNVLPRSYADVERGREAILMFGREVARLGGCPLAEHGVGRNSVKQELLRQLYGDTGIEEMRAVKRALDPGWKLAPGVIFPKPAAL
jgi:D-lactate dehydrogenase (cytochrome)